MKGIIMKTGLRIFIFLTVVVASISMMYLPYVEIKEKSISKLNERQLLIAKQAALSIESFINEQSNMLHHFATHPFFIKFGKNGQESMRREYDYFSKHIKAITRYNEKGIIEYSYPFPEKSLGADISSQPHVEKILSDHKPNVSDVFTAVQGFQAIAVSEPIFDGEKFVGAIAFLIDFKYIAKTYLEDIRIGDDGYAWMISRDGTELYCPVPGHIGENVKVTSASFPTVIEMAENMEKGYSGTATYTYDMVKGAKTATITKQAAYYPVRLIDNLWSITVATPESEIYSEFSSFYQKMIASMFMLILAISLFGYVLFKDYNLSKINTELENRVIEEMDKRKSQDKIMLQQARFYSMGETMNAIAHQWRQPLNSIGLCIQDIEEAYKMGQLDANYIEDMVGRSMHNLNNLSDTIDDFRSFYAPSEKLAKVNICGVIFSIHSIVKVQYDALRINFNFEVDGRHTLNVNDCDAEAFTAEIYPDMLKQVVLSCLQNSKEAIQNRLDAGEIERGEITLSLSKTSSHFIIEISDNGGGIPDYVIDRIFDPYFSTKGVSIGMGMGLYMSKNIVEDHMKGTINLVKIPEGTKAVIRFRTL